MQIRAKLAIHKGVISCYSNADNVTASFSINPEDDMKKVFLFILFLMAASKVYALEDGRTTHGPLTRILIVEGRGFANLIGEPLVDIPRTTFQEIRMHHWLWPFTSLPRNGLNFMVRVTSAVHDICFMPWIAPFTDDISPFTESMGLPEYPWQGFRGY